MVGGEGGGVDKPIDSGGGVFLTEKIAGLGANGDVDALFAELICDGAFKSVGAGDLEATVVGKFGEGADAGAGYAGEINIHAIIVPSWVASVAR